MATRYVINKKVLLDDSDSTVAAEDQQPPTASRAYSWAALLRKKPLHTSLQQEAGHSGLGWLELTAYGIAGTIGSGIYVTCGRVARDHSGPGIIVSIGIAGLLSALAGLSYLEFASALPISGSSTPRRALSVGYAYFYALVGEFPAWFIGWNLTLEYAFSGAAISAGWVQYMVTLVEELGLRVPKGLYDVPLFWTFRVNVLAAAVAFVFCLPATRGVAFGARFTTAITLLNVSLIAFIVVVGGTQVKRANWTPFVPHGVHGLITGGGEMFFSFIGFETVSTFAPDAVNPSRDIPIAMLATIGVATVLYIGVGLVVTGMQPSASLDSTNPLAMAFVQSGLRWAYFIVTACALTTMTAAIIATVLGQPKIFRAIANDGLLPRSMQGGPAWSPFSAVGVTILLTVFLALSMDMTTGLIDVISFGCLFGMALVCAAVVACRFGRHPRWSAAGPATVGAFVLGCIATSALLGRVPWAVAAPVGAVLVAAPFAALCVFFWTDTAGHLKSTSAHFICPLMPVLPCISIFADVYVMAQLNPLCIPQYLGWCAAGVVVYLAYGIRNSRLRSGGEGDEEGLKKGEAVAE